MRGKLMSAPGDSQTYKKVEDDRRAGMRIRIDSSDKQATAAILAAVASQEGAQTLPPGVEVVHRTAGGLSPAKSAGLPEALQILLSLGSGVASNLVSNWLYDLLKRHRVTLEIDGKRVAIDPSNIQSAIEHANDAPDGQ
jgi:hypothetical protein